MDLVKLRTVTTKVSIVSFLLAVCDAKYNFTTVNVGAYGSNNDIVVSGFWLNSEMGQKFEEEAHDIPKPEPLGRLQNKGTTVLSCWRINFPLKTWMMRPYSGSLNEQQSFFNYRLSRARRVIENTFGILVARWRLFRGPIRASRDNVVPVHNGCSLFSQLFTTN